MEKTITNRIEEIEQEIQELSSGGVSKSAEVRMKIRKLSNELKKLKSSQERKGKGIFISEEEKSVNIIRFVPIDEIELRHEHLLEKELDDRSYVDKDKLQSLAKSMDEIGLEQPIILYKTENGKYRNRGGRRRIEAAKMLGWKKIPAVIREKAESVLQHNLSILHENTEREDLSPYDKVRAVLMFLFDEFELDKQDFEKSYQDMKKRLIKVLNYQKGIKKASSKEEEEELEKELGRILNILSLTKIFKTVAHFVQNMYVIEMHPLIIDNMKKGGVSFNFAEYLHKVRKNEFCQNFTYETILQTVFDEKMSPGDAKEFIQSCILQKKDEKPKIDQYFGQLKKILKKIPKEEIGNFEKELASLLEKYSQ